MGCLSGCSAVRNAGCRRESASQNHADTGAARR